jgi:hypothetical protein
MPKIKASRTLNVNGMIFAKGDSGKAIFYEAKANGCVWFAQRLHDTSRFPSYWFAGVVLQDGKGLVCPLNMAVQHANGKLDADPLYNETDLGITHRCNYWQASPG